ncbi:hypothetical protein [Vibrio sp. 10N]|uniref:hypothetical protein n=1 Tax=Vibrio sp. 10N TaxID=3058938 RepID=UPI0028129F27|nr:hypothetical protein VB10N_26300 [Vibrio sp. 10N]
MQNYTTDVEQIYKSYGIPTSGYQNLERSDEIKSSQSKWNFLQPEKTVQSETPDRVFTTPNNQVEPFQAPLEQE